MRASGLRSCVASHMADAETRVVDNASDAKTKHKVWPIMTKTEVVVSESRGAGGRRHVVDNQQQLVTAAAALHLISHFSSLPSQPILMSPAAISSPGAQLSICSARINTEASPRLPRDDRWRTIKLNADSH